jgi:membrane fusion protein, heavy metal efflux system
MRNTIHLIAILTALAFVGSISWAPILNEAMAQKASAERVEHDDDEHEGHDGDEHEGHDGDEHKGHDDDGYEGHDDGDGERGDDEHGDHEEGQVVRLDDATMWEFGVEVATASSGNLKIHVSLPGEVIIDPDKLAHIVPRVSGIAHQVFKKLGDPVRAGEVMAVLQSRELSESKSVYLVAKERSALAEATFQREEKLWKQEISSEREYLETRQALAEARIEMRAADQKLHALGFSESYLKQLRFGENDSFTRYEVVAPFDGTVIEKHITLGELLQSETEAFVVADLSSVWVNLTVYQNDLPFVFQGQPAHISAGVGMPTAAGQISYVSPIIDEETRTATARVVLSNVDGKWRPGTFITGTVGVEQVEVETIVPKTALQTIDNHTVVFVETEEGFEPHPVTLGRVNDTLVEVVAGLHRGQRYVADGSFVLKAQLAKGAFGDGHNH